MMRIQSPLGAKVYSALDQRRVDLAGVPLGDQQAPLVVLRAGRPGRARSRGSATARCRRRRPGTRRRAACHAVPPAVRGSSGRVPACVGRHATSPAGTQPGVGSDRRRAAARTARGRDRGRAWAGRSPRRSPRAGRLAPPSAGVRLVEARQGVAGGEADQAGGAVEGIDERSGSPPLVRRRSRPRRGPPTQGRAPSGSNPSPRRSRRASSAASPPAPASRRRRSSADS